MDRLVTGSGGEGIDGAEYATHSGPGTPAQHALPLLDRVLGATAHASQELIAHLHDLVEEGLAPLDQIAGDQCIPLRLGEAAEIAGIVAASELAELADDPRIDPVEIGTSGQ